MPDDNQTTTPPITDDNSSTNGVADPSMDLSGADSAAIDAAVAGIPGMSDSASDNTSVNLQDLEYATPSAYIDPDLPQTTEEAPEETPEETPEDDLEGIEMTPEQIAEALKASNAVMAKVAEKIASSRNILIALSSDPSVDELAAAISLSMFLDRLGKHAIAIYSGTTPNALEFLHPEDKFEADADVLQDFVIALNKEKADHLRYKLDGDYVKVFITPYRDKIAAENLEFSYGDYNVDLVLALNVDNGVDLDAALREYGRIMHDATVVNITTGNPGKFGEIEWNNKRASSISEMISNLLLSANGDTTLSSDEATALLTGIVAATDRFARANTFPATMEVASKLLDFGADQQLVAANISDDLDNQFFTFSEAAKAKREAEAATDTVDEDYAFSFKSEEPVEKLPADGSALKISHGDEEEDVLNTSPAESIPAEEDGKPEASEPEGIKSDEAKPEEPKSEEPENSALLDELKATEASLSNAGAEVVNPETGAAPAAEDTATESVNAPAESASAPAEPVTINPSPEMNIPASGYSDVTSKYSQMLEDALNEPASSGGAPMESVLPPATPAVNPAASIAPDVSATPEITGVPEINYGQSADQVLPPPPAPPVDLGTPMPMPSGDSLSTPAEPAPAAPVNDASAFTIPGI